jgi:antitoxin (DNA-binding transcriptional repressor) of toxin-antitoxin stability system
MVTVGVRNLKDRLSQYLQYVKDGETVIVTEHNKIIAEISTPQKQAALTPFEQKLVQLSKEGEVILAKRRKPIAKPLKKITEAEKSIDILVILDEVRADRFP